MAQLKELGLSPEVVKHLLSTQMMLDEDSADLVAKGLSQAKAPDDGQGFTHRTEAIMGIFDTIKARVSGADKLNKTLGNAEGGALSKFIKSMMTKS